MDRRAIIPTPNRGRPPKYDFTGLKSYGDAVLITGGNETVMRSCAYHYAKTNGFKVACRATSSGMMVYHIGAVGEDD